MALIGRGARLGGFAVLAEVHGPVRGDGPAVGVPPQVVLAVDLLWRQERARVPELVRGHHVAVQLAVERDVHVLAGGRDDQHRLVHVFQRPVHRDRALPAGPPVMGFEQHRPGVIGVQEHGVDGAAPAARVGVGGHLDLRVELPPNTLAGQPADELLGAPGGSPVGGLAEQHAGPRAARRALVGVDPGDQLVDQARVARVGGDRGLPVALVPIRRAGRLLGAEPARPGTRPPGHPRRQHRDSRGKRHGGEQRARPHRTPLLPGIPGAPMYHGPESQVNGIRACWPLAAGRAILLPAPALRSTRSIPRRWPS